MANLPKMPSFYPFQREGIDLLHAKDGCALLADQMGMGKSCQAYGYAVESGLSPVIVTCPTSLCLHWQREYRVHFGLPSLILQSQSPRLYFNRKRLSIKRVVERGGVFIVGYDVLKDWLSFFLWMKPRLVIGDEIHQIGNLNSLRSKAFRRLCQDVDHVIAISGTPFTNRPWELYPILHTLDPDTFDSPFAFGHRFCQAEMRYGEWRFSGAKNLKALHKLLKDTVLIRRLKKDVLPQLPASRRFIVPLEIKDREQYEKAESDLFGWLSEHYGLDRAYRATGNERYTRFTYLKQLAAFLKVKYVNEWLDVWLENNPTGKLFVGVHHYNITDLLMQNRQSYSLLINGKVPQKERMRIQDRFRQDPRVRILFGQIRCCGVGLNLPEANAAALVELPWTPGACEQFIARIERITTKHETEAYYLVAHDTIEETLCEILQRKKKHQDLTFDGVDTREDTFKIFDELQREMTRERKECTT